MQNTITEAAAAQHLQDLIHQALTVLPPTARPEQGLTDSLPCDDPTDNGPKGRVTPSTSYQIHDLPAEQYGSYFDNLHAWWTDHDFRVIDERHVSPLDRYLFVENNTDGFRMGIRSNDNGGLYLTASSPCVWPHGTPEPTS